MTTRRKGSDEEIERKLVSDAGDPSAWEKPMMVGPSRSPRPAWYRRSKHLELAAKFYVLSVLHRLGAEANLTYAQPDNVDIAAVRRSGEVFTIDVKTLTGTGEWPIQPLSARKHHFVVFVRFQEDWHQPHAVPEVYIWPSEDLLAYMAERKSATVSLDMVAQKLDPKSAWDQFAVQPAA